MYLASIALALALLPADKEPALMPVLTPTTTPGDEAVLKAVKLGTSDEALLHFFRQRTPPAPERAVIADWARKLAAKTTSAGDEAQGELIAIGLPAVPLLRQTANNIDEVESSTRARTCLLAIEGGGNTGIVLNAARLLAGRKPPGAAEVLLGYLPFADDETIFQEVESALVAVGLREGKPDPALLRALKDPVALRRGTAAHVLCQIGGPAYHPPIRPLLADSSPSVRLKAALGLVSANDAEAIPVLIDLLADLPPRGRQQAEEYLSNLAGEWAVRGPQGNDLTSRKLRRDVWAAWWKQTDGDRLLEEFTSRTLSDDERDKILGLIQKLDDSTPEARDAASRELITLGGRTAPLLRRAINQGHPRISPQASRILEAVEKDAANPLPSAAVRLLGLRKPTGTVKAVLAYLPFAESDHVANLLIDLLASRGVQDGKPDEALLRALEDRAAPRRAAAALALCKARVSDAKPAIRKLLADKDLEVRFRAAQGLASLGDKESIPVLIDLLADLPLELVWEVEEFLSQVAGDKTPTTAIASDPEGRKKSVAAWSEWWKEHGKTVDLTRIEPGVRELGFLLVVENWNPAKGKGRVLELDSAGKVRWEIEELFWPYDAQVLRGGNVLVIEQQNRVSERDRSGKVVWNKYINNVFHCERLRNGTTFLACRNQLMIVDRAGNAVFSHPYNGGTILAAKRFRDGSMGFVSYSGHYVRLDRAGKEIVSRNLPWVNFSVNGAEVLPDDRVIVSVANQNKVIEFNSEGRQVWEASVVNPLIPFRLSNGHTLVASNGNLAITEIDSTGKVVGEQRGLPYRPYRVYKR
jgi:HEAT repeat protein/outer membrane protein assembly factor BamB